MQEKTCKCESSGASKNLEGQIRLAPYGLSSSFFMDCLIKQNNLVQKDQIHTKF